MSIYNISIFTNNPLNELEFYFSSLNEAQNWFDKTNLGPIPNVCDFSIDEDIDRFIFSVELDQEDFKKFKLNQGIK